MFGEGYRGEETGGLRGVLTASFKTFLEAYDRDCPFTRHGQLQYHVETISRRRRLGSAKLALADEEFQRALEAAPGYRPAEHAVAAIKRKLN